MAAAVAGGVVFGRWVARRTRAPEPEGQPKEGDSGPAPPPVAAAGDVLDPSQGRKSSAAPADKPRPKKKPVQDDRDLLADFPCHLGDVVMVHTGEEAWLAGALVFFESLPAAALFVAPEAGGDRALYVRPGPPPSIAWLAPLPAGELAVGAEPPSTLEHKGDRFERVRRIPYRVEREGTGAPDVGEQAVVAEYTSGEARLLVVTGTGAPRMWRGHMLEDGTYDVLASGKSTLEN
jgi:hypothetical protein